jgi:CBS domain containing-hemolysin-like protein
LEKIVEVANENLKNYLLDLNESELNQVKKYLTLPKDEISKRYDVLSELVIEKLENMLSESDKETNEKITETISKIKNDTVDSISLIKLKTLNENL